MLDGALLGDLLVEGGGDPSLVDEDALLVADRLLELGIRQVVGDLRLRGALTFDWQSDEDGSRLRRALSGSISPGALATVRAWELENPGGSVPSPGSLKAQGIRFEPPATPPEAGGERPDAAVRLVERALIIHRSQPLLALAKS